MEDPKFFCCCSATQLCPTLCDPKECSMPGFTVLHHLPELAQTHVHWVGNAIQLSYHLLSPSPLALNARKNVDKGSVPEIEPWPVISMEELGRGVVGEPGRASRLASTLCPASTYLPNICFSVPCELPSSSLKSQTITLNIVFCLSWRWYLSRGLRPLWWVSSPASLPCIHAIKLLLAFSLIKLSPVNLILRLARRT